MNILLADSDRDLLQSYQKLLTMDGHLVTTAFDGAQVVSLLRARKYDIVVLQDILPRIEHEQILLLLRKEKIPVIALTDHRENVKDLLKPQLPNSYLPFPFLPVDLTEKIQAVMEKIRSAEKFSRCGVEIDVAGFCISGTDIFLTNGEIDLLRILENPGKSSGKRTRVIVQALNQKLQKTGKQVRIIYEIGKGYRLVNEHD